MISLTTQMQARLQSSHVCVFGLSLAETGVQHRDLLWFLLCLIISSITIANTLHGFFYTSRSIEPRPNSGSGPPQFLIGFTSLRVCRCKSTGGKELTHPRKWPVWEIQPATLDNCKCYIHSGNWWAPSTKVLSWRRTEPLQVHPSPLTNFPKPSKNRSYIWQLVNLKA